MTCVTFQVPSHPGTRGTLVLTNPNPPPAILDQFVLEVIAGYEYYGKPDIEAEIRSYFCEDARQIAGVEPELGTFDSFVSWWHWHRGSRGCIDWELDLTVSASGLSQVSSPVHGYPGTRARVVSLQ